VIVAVLVESHLRDAAAGVEVHDVGSRERHVAARGYRVGAGGERADLWGHRVAQEAHDAEVTTRLHGADAGCRYHDLAVHLNGEALCTGAARHQDEAIAAEGRIRSTVRVIPAHPEIPQAIPLRSHDLTVGLNGRGPG